MKNRIPSYRLHKGSGQAVVTLEGRDYYLGPHGSEESRAEYRRLTGLYVAGGMAMPREVPASTVNEVLIGFWARTEPYYRKGGRPTSHLRFIKIVCRRVHDLFGPTKVVDFGPAALKALRESWVVDGNTRTTANRKASVVKRIIDWGVEEGLVPGSVSHALKAVRGLTKGRTAAPDRPAVSPVPPDVLDATLAVLRPRVAAMVQLQILTGMRPGEVCAIRPCDVDQGGEIWAYTPTTHKTEHHGRARVIAIGPCAQAMLGPWLHLFGSEFYCFSMNGRLPASEKVYRLAIARACREAGVPVWAPNRLRHNAATAIRARFGLDGAQVALGHARCDVTQVYADLDWTRAAAIAAAIG